MSSGTCLGTKGHLLTREVQIFLLRRRGGGEISETPAECNQPTQRVHNGDADWERADKLSDIDSVSDFSDADTDQDIFSDSENDTSAESEALET